MAQTIDHNEARVGGCSFTRANTPRTSRRDALAALRPDCGAWRRVRPSGRPGPTVPTGNILRVADSFFVPLGEDRWLATVHTTGPWDERAQHGGPPSALLGRAMLRCEPRDDMVVARFTTEILTSIPVGEIEVRARVARPGRSVQLLEAVLTAAGREVAWARAWRVLRTECPDTGPGLAKPPPLPEASAPLTPGGWVDGYLSAIEWRAVHGIFGEPGPATVWARMRYALVPDEEPGPAGTGPGGG